MKRNLPNLKVGDIIVVEKKRNGLPSHLLNQPLKVIRIARLGAYVVKELLSSIQSNVYSTPPADTFKIIKKEDLLDIYIKNNVDEMNQLSLEMKRISDEIKTITEKSKKLGLLKEIIESHGSIRNYLDVKITEMINKGRTEVEEVVELRKIKELATKYKLI